MKMHVIQEKKQENEGEEELILEILLTHLRRSDIFVEGQFY